ncbi:MAG: glycosyltransferase family 4 protein [Nitrospirae bacterium]|nr:glycosyltransferase family 4 protein [Nitrospirota bacterium]
MKILHLLYESKGDYFGVGGVGTRAYEIYGRLKDRHEITLLCRKYPGAKDGEIEGLRHIFAGAESKNFTKALLSYACNAAVFVAKYGDEFDVIIEEFSPAVPTFLHCFTKRPVVLQVQGHTGGLYFRKYNPAYASTLYFLEKLRPLFYDNFIFISKETVNRFLPKRGPGGRIEIIPNGISPALLNAVPEEDNYILYFGRIDIYAKGLDTLVEAYKDFHGSFPGIRLVIAGDGREMEEFKDMLVKLPDDLRGGIELPGWVSGDKKIEIIRRALFVVLPSRHEVQPIAVLEELACGKAIVISDIPELSYVTENRAGVSFTTGNAAALARAMKDLASGKDLREMGQRGRALVKDITWDKTALRFEAFLEKVIRKE